MAFPTYSRFNLATRVAKIQLVNFQTIAGENEIGKYCKPALEMGYLVNLPLSRYCFIVFFSTSVYVKKYYVNTLPFTRVKVTKYDIAGA